MQTPKKTKHSFKSLENSRPICRKQITFIILQVLTIKSKNRENFI